MQYLVKLDMFEGPMDTLLEMVKNNELDIFQVSLGQITSQYLNYIQLPERVDLDIISEFFVAAATLLLIKSKLLLPSPLEQSTEEEPSEELAISIMEYEKFRQAANILKEREMSQRNIYGRLPLVPEEKEYTLDASLFDLLTAFQNLVLKTRKEVREIIGEDLKVEDRIKEILKLLKNKRFISFDRIFSGQKTKALLIVSFLALLELIRQKKVFARQARPFGEIRIYKATEELLA